MASAAVWILFFLSGACGLIYEVLWSRHLGLILGNTTYSLAAVLSAFMAGLALGSYLAGRGLERRLERGPVALLKLYGVLEIIIGLYCLALPWLFDAAAPLYAGLYGETGNAVLGPARFIVSFLLLLAPTTCMGATLPILSQLMARSPLGMSRAAGALYAVNTFGAVAGAAGAGFVLLPLLGREATNYAAVGGNLVLGVLAILLNDRLQGAALQAQQPAQQPAGSAAAAAASTAETPGPQAMRLAIACFGVTGFAAMATQIGWTRALSLAIGSSTYAFSLIVSVFILGLALGGAWSARSAAKLKDPLGSLAQVLLLIGVLCMALVTLLGYGPVLFFWLIAYGSQWGFGMLMLAEALGVAALLLLPTFLMGATLPLMLQTVQARAEHTGGVARTVGTLYAINTTGSILGSLAGGLVLLPLLQIQTTLQTGAWLYALPGALLFSQAPARRERRSAILASLLLLGTLALTFTPRWDPLRMSSGAYLLRSPEQLQAAREGRFMQAIPQGFGTERLYYKEGASATVAVVKSAVGLTLTVGGKPDASSGSEDMTTQLGLTLVPELLHPTGPREVLVIGMGSGVSLGAALAPPSVERVDMVEISPEVMEAAWWFRELNGLKYASNTELSPLAEPRVQVLINDGRNHLRLTSRRYDVIASEPSNPWIAGIGNLFTREAFELCRDRLKPGGIFSQWLHRYGMSEREFKSVMRTFAEVFPHTQLWCVLPGSDYLLIGSSEPLSQTPAALLERMRAPAVQALLKQVNFHRLEELLACFMADTDRVKELCGAAPLHTDDNMLLEFAAPRTLHGGGAQFPLMPWRVSAERTLKLAALAPAERRALQRALDLAAAARIGLDRANDRTGPHKDLVDTALVFSPDLYWARHTINRAREAQAQAGIPADRQTEPWTPVMFDTAPELAAKAAEKQPAQRNEWLAHAHETRGAWWMQQGRLAEAAQEAVKAAGYLPKRPNQALLRAWLHAAKGEVEPAVAAAREAEQWGAGGINRLEAVAQAMLNARQYEPCVRFIDALLDKPQVTGDTNCAALWGQKAEALAALGRTDEALAAIQSAMQVHSSDARAQQARVAIALSLPGPGAPGEAAKGLNAFRAYMDPRDPRAWLTWGDFELLLAMRLEKDGDAAGAQEHRRRARAAAHALTLLAPDAPRGWWLLMRAWQALGDAEAAEAAKARAASLETAR